MQNHATQESTKKTGHFLTRFISFKIKQASKNAHPIKSHLIIIN